MKKSFALYLTALIIITSFSACTGGGAGGGEDLNIPAPDPNITIDGGPYTVETLSNTGSFMYELDGLSNNDVFFIFTNYSNYKADSRPEAWVVLSEQETPLLITENSYIPRGSNFELAIRGADSLKQEEIEALASLQVAKKTELSTIYRNSLPISHSSATEGDTGTFRDDIAEVDVSCTLAKVVPVGAYSPKRLEIWVENSYWDETGSGGNGTINQTMVDYLADYFMNTTDENDIYHWITNVFGSEWGTHPFNGNLISTLNGKYDNSISIILHDIESDGVPGVGESRTVGYFTSLHNYINTPDYESDECIRFSLDAALYSSETWSTDNYWVKQTISTLAHEFQHMIHFYQKQVLNNVGFTDTWINEMCSLVAEDLVSNKIEVDGPRGVDYTIGSAGLSGNSSGRLPYYVPEFSLTTWLGDLYSYAASYSFGAYLSRNFGGASLFGEIVKNEYVDAEAILSEIPGETLESLLVKWGVANIISEIENPNTGITLNTGGFLNTTGNGTTYQLGAINMFNYIEKVTDSYGDYYWHTNGVNAPFIYTPFFLIGLDAPENNSNLYYEAGINLSGQHSWDISLPEGVRLTTIIK